MTPDTPSGLTRYSEIDHLTAHGEKMLYASKSGEWCRYSDVAPIVERCKRLEAAAQAFLYQTPFIGTDAYDAARTNLRAALSEKGEP